METDSAVPMTVTRLSPVASTPAMGRFVGLRLTVSRVNGKISIFSYMSNERTCEGDATFYNGLNSRFMTTISKFGDGLARSVNAKTP